MGLRLREYAGSNAKQVKFVFYYVHVCLVPGAYCNTIDALVASIEEAVEINLWWQRWKLSNVCVIVVFMCTN